MLPNSRHLSKIILTITLLIVSIIASIESATLCGTITYSTSLSSCSTGASNAYEDHLTAIAMGPNSQLAITSGINPPNYISWANGATEWSCEQQNALPEKLYHVDGLLFWPNSSLWYTLSDHSLFSAPSPDSSFVQVESTQVKLGFWRSLASSDNTVVIVGDSPLGGMGKCFLNAQSWIDFSLPVDEIFNIEAVAYGGPDGDETFLFGAQLTSVGGERRVPLFISKDGCDWKISNATFTGADQCDSISHIAYGNNVWMIFCFSEQSSQSYIWLSSDNANSFTLLSTVSGEWIYETSKLRFINGMFVAVGKGGALNLSDNGSAWSSCSLSISSDLLDVSSAGSEAIIAVGTDYQIVNMNFS